VLFLFVGDERAVDYAVLNGNIRIIDIKLRGILVTDNRRYERFVRHVVAIIHVLLILRIEYIFSWIKRTGHSWSSIWTIMWIECIATVVLLLNISHILFINVLLIDRISMDHCL